MMEMESNVLVMNKHLAYINVTQPPFETQKYQIFSGSSFANLEDDGCSQFDQLYCGFGREVTVQFRVQLTDKTIKDNKQNHKIYVKGTVTLTPNRHLCLILEEQRDRQHDTDEGFQMRSPGDTEQGLRSTVSSW